MHMLQKSQILWDLSLEFYALNIYTEILLV